MPKSHPLMLMSTKLWERWLKPNCVSCELTPPPKCCCTWSSYCCCFSFSNIFPHTGQSSTWVRFAIQHMAKRAPAPGAAPRGSQGRCPQQGRQRCTKGSALPPPQPLLPLSPRTPLLLASCCKELVASAATLGLKQVQSLAGEGVGGRVWSWVVGGRVGTRMVWGERSWRELRQSWRCPCSPRKIERGEHSRGSQCWD